MTSTDLVHGRTLGEWRAELPLMGRLLDMEETSWFPGSVPSSIDEGALTAGDLHDAAARLKRFAPYLLEVFPETSRTMGILESPLVGAPAMLRRLGEAIGRDIPGELWVKLDSELPISGSIKARGGIYEVLKHAEDLAVAAGMLDLGTDDYRVLAQPRFTEFFGGHSVAVGSTGNLGLSIGIMSARLGFRALVHMSSDARQWKKDKLRANGVEVIEHEGDYSEAVAAGRAQADADPSAYFVDDENSRTLFLGYAVAAHRLAGQLQSLAVAVDDDHPLFVYLPCGVGGGPGGIAFGLKQEFGDAVHVVFAEPTHSPSMLMGVYTGLHDAMVVQDFGIDNVTAADGLAVGRPSGFVGRTVQGMVDGYVTVADDHLFALLADLHETEGIDIEPSSTAGFAGIGAVLAADDYRRATGLTDDRMARATHIAWATGGSMVPADEMVAYVSRGRELRGAAGQNDL